ncbi:MAG: hypothetical protein JWL69_3066, partial [Phycisphaerales bacterium]|nr:hypothetical protein [Phycisphaerales bacterium]
FAWVPRDGANRLEVKAVNQFGVDGPISTVELEMKAGKKNEGERRPSK